MCHCFDYDYPGVSLQLFVFCTNTLSLLKGKGVAYNMATTSLALKACTILAMESCSLRSEIGDIHLTMAFSHFYCYWFLLQEAFRKVYEWKYINCLELWTGAICEYGSEPDFKPLAYPLTQIISGVVRLVPTARYFPLRLRCARMLNRIAAATNTFIPISMLLLDMLEMKELHMPPTGGVGKAVDLRTILKVRVSLLSEI